jgi:acetyltransferase-like isoleucine patch superfamily enzyme
MWHLSSVTARGIAVRLFGLRPLLAGWRVELQGDVFVKGKVWAPGRGRLHVGRGVRLIGEPAPIELRAHEEAEIWIEDGVLIEGGTSIEATRSVRVGARSRIGPFCKILDNHFHAVSDRRLRPESVPIVIGEDCVLGPRAILLPGAEMGAGARVGPAGVLSFHLRAGAELA